MFLAKQGVADLDRMRFEQWRSTFRHLHRNSRHTYERIVHNFCRYRRRSEPGCFCARSGFAHAGGPPCFTDARSNRRKSRGC